MKFEVPIIYRGLANFIVDAETPAEAVEIAREKFRGGDYGDILGNESEEIERIGDVEEITPTAQS